MNTPIKYYEMQNVGHAKYVVNVYEGQKHSDGSDFYGIAIFSNRRVKDKFVRSLVAQGAVRS